MEIRVRPMTAGDVQAVAAVHERAFDDSFLARMGVRFLAEFYRGYVDSTLAVTRVAVTDDGHLAGFVVGAVDVEGFNSWLYRSRALRLAAAVILQVFKTPSLALHVLARVPRVARAFRRPPGPAAESRGHPGLPRASLTSIAVHPDMRGRGVASRLIRAFESDLVARGVRDVKLGVRQANAAARRCYEGLGWVLVPGAPADAIGCMYVRELPEMPGDVPPATQSSS